MVVVVHLRRQMKTRLDQSPKNAQILIFHAGVHEVPTIAALQILALCPVALVMEAVAIAFLQG